MLGDTLGAIRRLDAVLDALPLQRTDLLAFVSQAAGLPRAMALRAELAARGGDTATAQRRAQVVIVLWSNADESLQPLVQRMRLVAARGR